MSIPSPPDLKVMICLRNDQSAKILSLHPIRRFPILVECYCQTPCEFRGDLDRNRHPICRQGDLLTEAHLDRTRTNADSPD